MYEKRISTNISKVLNFYNVLDKPMERPPHPSIHEKIRTTERLLKEGVDQNKLVSKGGLDIETHEALKKRNEIAIQSLKEFQDDLHKQVLKDSNINGIFDEKMPCDKIKPVKGSRKALVLPIDFKDNKNKTEAEHFKKMLFTKGSMSMRDYFLENSWNQLDIDGDVSEWTTAEKEREYYVDKLYDKKSSTGGIAFPQAQILVEEAVMNAHKCGTDFSNYDTNGDGLIDMLIIICAGVGFDTSLKINYISPHTASLNKPITFKIEKKEYTIERYAIIPELSAYDSQPDDLGCFCHEMAHILGIPELYSPDFTSDSQNFSPVLGYWCLMGVGSYTDHGKIPTHMGAWCKKRLGWVEPLKVSGKPKEYPIPAVIDSAKKIYQFEIKNSKGKEYFLIENREQKGFDQYIPANGLLIWHVDENQCLGDFPNGNRDHHFLSLEQADGKKDLELTMKDNDRDIDGDAGDVFPGTSNKRAFNDETEKVNSKSYSGDKSCIQISSISDPGDLMTAIMGIKCIK